MAIVGLIPFVYAAIKMKRRSTARADDSYAGLAAGGTVARGHEHVRGAYQSQSCHFAVCPSPDDELGFSFHDYGAGRPPARALTGDLSRELFSADPCERLPTTGAPREGGRRNSRFDGGGYQSQSCRFTVRTSPVDGLALSRDGGASRCPPGSATGGSLATAASAVLPDSRRDGLATGAARGQEHARSNGSAYQSKSCRFAVHHSEAYEHGLSHDGVDNTSPEDLSGKLLLPASRSERGMSRSRRFSSMRVFAWVSGA